MDHEVSSGEAVFPAINTKRRRKQMKPVKVHNSDTRSNEQPGGDRISGPSRSQLSHGHDTTPRPKIHGSRPLDLSGRELKRKRNDSDSKEFPANGVKPNRIHEPQNREIVGHGSNTDLVAGSSDFSTPRQPWSDSQLFVISPHGQKTPLIPAEDERLKQDNAVHAFASTPSSSSPPLPDSTKFTTPGKLRPKSAHCCHTCSREFCDKYFLEAHILKKHQGKALHGAVRTEHQYAQNVMDCKKNSQPEEYQAQPASTANIETIQQHMPMSRGITCGKSSDGPFQDDLIPAEIRQPAEVVEPDSKKSAAPRQTMQLSQERNDVRTGTVPVLAHSNDGVELIGSSGSQQQRPTYLDVPGHQPSLLNSNSDAALLRLMLSTYQGTKRQPSIPDDLVDLGSATTNSRVTTSNPYTSMAFSPLVCTLCKQTFCTTHEFLRHWMTVHQRPTAMIPHLSSTSSASPAHLAASFCPPLPGLFVAHQTASSSFSQAPNSAADSTLVSGFNAEADFSANKRIPPQLLKIQPKSSLQAGRYCHICNKELCNKYFLKTHMLKMHGIVYEHSAVTALASQAAKSPLIGVGRVNALLEAHIIDFLNAKEPQTAATGQQLENAATDSEVSQDLDGHEIVGGFFSQNEGCHPACSRAPNRNVPDQNDHSDETPSPESTTPGVVDHQMPHILQGLLNKSQVAE